ncbi:MAG: response regulator [Candidatus Tectimicrobiota bacterium]
MEHKSILLVEDNPDDEELTLLAFRKSQLTQAIYIVRDGAEALDYLFGTGAYSDRAVYRLPSVILLDLKLPKVSGLEVLRRVRATEHTRLLPVVILTSSREEHDLIESYNLGVNSYIVKPVEFEKYTQTVGHVGVYWASLNEPAPWQEGR